GQDPLDWLEELSEAVEINDWDDKRALALALVLLHPTAKKTFQSIKFDDFKKAFRERYHQAYYKERAYAQAQTYRQAAHEDVDVLAANVFYFVSHYWSPSLK
ncbi:hypothetical protein EC968_004567, partial [Mortierella alpina]